MQNLFNGTGVHIPEILLPSRDVDLSGWAVIACDQFTSQPDYWRDTEKKVGDRPSALRLIFPEIYLKDADSEARIKNINDAMAGYLKEGILKAQKPGFILVDRSTPRISSRKGLIIAVDLECYDYRPGSTSLIRATEGTVLERIPPRVRIRENAPVELPHIMLLIDDPCGTVIEPLFAAAGSFEKLYDFELMQGGGHIRGWKIDDRESLGRVADAFHKLADSNGGRLLFAVGDGNHSLAAAKAHWENVKAKLAPGWTVPVHPARYALVEVVNVHDEGLAFEPIHRVLFGIDGRTVLEEIKSSAGFCRNIGYRLFDSKEAMEAALKEEKEKTHGGAENAGNVGSAEKAPHLIPFILEGRYGILTVRNPRSSLEAGTLQDILDSLIKKPEIDYIHGDDVVTKLGSRKGRMGFYLPAMDKRDLFRTVILDGVLPRKTFSMGEAREKRYYLECRKIV